LRGGGEKGKGVKVDVEAYSIPPLSPPSGRGREKKRERRRKKRKE